MRLSVLSPLSLTLIIMMSVSCLFSQNYALQFDGLDDFVTINDSPSLNTLNQITIEAWVNLEDDHLDGNSTMLRKDGNYLLELGDAGNNCPAFLIWWSDMSDTRIDGPEIPKYEWHHWAATYDGQAMKLLIDGQEVSYYNIVKNMVTSSSELLIGMVDTEWFKGILDEVRIWDIALPQTEIQANMFRRVTDYEPGLVGYWSFNEGVGDTAFDYSGNNNHGIIHGASWIPSSAPTGLTFFFAHPNIAYQNHPLSTSFRGTNTHFADSSGTSNVWLSRGDTLVFAENFTVHSNFEMYAVFSIPVDAPGGFWDTNIETAIDSVITMNNGIEILTPPAVFPQNSGTSDWLKGITATDNLHAWAVGNQGTMILTTDGGENWSLQNSGTANTLNAVCFTDVNTGWTVGQVGLILHTGNGGIDWITQNSGTSNNLQSVFFIDTNIGWVVGSNGSILNTTDGGLNWINQNSGTSSWLYAVCFIDDNHGWASGSNGTILHTTDGGGSWTAQSSGTLEYLFSIQFMDNSTGWAVGMGGTILHTSNGGNSWTVQNSGTASWLRSVHFMSADTGFAVGNAGTYLMTTDGGGVWDSRRSMTGSTLNGICFADHNSGWLVGEAGTIMKMTFQGVLTSIDGGTIANSIIPVRFELLQNYPNPFNPTTIISYHLPRRSEVVLKVYNLLGQEVSTLLNTIQVAGEHQVVWDGKDRFDRTVSSGVYIYTLQAENYFNSRKMLFLK